jgi:hypothetical protein
MNLLPRNGCPVVCFAAVAEKRMFHSRSLATAVFLDSQSALSKYVTVLTGSIGVTSFNSVVFISKRVCSTHKPVHVCSPPILLSYGLRGRSSSHRLTDDISRHTASARHSLKHRRTQVYNIKASVRE